MKTSNKIIIILTIIIVGSILTLFSTSKLHEKFVKDSIVWKTNILQPFSVVVAEDSSEVDIHKSSDYKTIVTNSVGKVTKQTYRIISVIDVETNKLKPAVNRPFKLNGDTLFIYKGSKLVVHSSTNLISVIGKKHLKLEMWGFDPDSIYFNLKGGETSFHNSEKKMSSFQIIARDGAELRFDFKTVKLVIDAEESKIFMGGEIDNFKANVRKNTKLWGIAAPNSAEFIKDSTSSIQ